MPAKGESEEGCRPCRQRWGRSGDVGWRSVRCWADAVTRRRSLQSPAAWSWAGDTCWQALTSLAVADMNGDARPDLLVTRGETGDLAMLLRAP